jgi:imidazolonepropionase-like amidohydrolase
LRSTKIFLCALVSASALALSISSRSPARNQRIVIAASTVLDGKGGVLRDTRIVIEGPKIVAIDPKAGPVDYDLRGLTVLPGWIDAHVHITWSFGRDGKNAGQGGTTQEAAYASLKCVADINGGIYHRPKRRFAR